MMHRHVPTVVVLTTIVTLIGTGAVSAQQVDDLGQGKLLVAREGMADPNFSRTVVLLVRYGEAGAMGVVLNRPSHMRINHMLPHLELSEEEDDVVYMGGPVAVRTATILATAEELRSGDTRVFGDTYATGNLELLERMATEPRPGERFRVYAGHAGWAPGQLEAEVLRLGWHVFPASEAIVFADSGEDLWEIFIRRTRTRIAMR